ncbi:DUF3429 domain-containing protein [Sphaerotilus sp.]|uniref:DUF3429 domain-containing protein n=1 Tax=Sphaerotilus sp. TaxID=2093942 RepID=UPI0034E2B04A
MSASPLTPAFAVSPTLSVPDRLAVRLGHAGLVPFVLGAVLAMLVRADVLPYVVLSLSVYAGMIVSFLGGIHWGLLMMAHDAAPRRLAWAVTPTLLGWVSVVMPPHAGLVIQALLLIVCYLVDRRVYPAYGLSKWLTLRFRLTLVASMSCFLAAAASSN